MSLYLIGLAALFFAVLFSQFGHRLPARRGLIWLAVAAFLFISAVNPFVWLPITALLKIEKVSNFVLAGMMMFLFFQMVEQQAENLRFSRQITELVTAAAASEFALPGTVRALIVLPCHNEMDALPRVLARIDAVTRAAPEITFCVVNDGSTDGTADVLAKLAPERFVTHATNVGVSGGLLTGFRIAERIGAQFVVQCDADGQHPVEEIPRLIAEASKQGADLVIGSRLVPGADGAAPSPIRRTGALFIRGALRLFGRRAQVTDPTSGFRAYSRQAIAVLRRNIPDEYPEPESIAACALAGLVIAEVPAHMEKRTTGESSLRGFAGPIYVSKVVTALIGLRLRTMFRRLR